MPTHGTEKLTFVLNAVQYHLQFKKQCKHSYAIYTENLNFVLGAVQLHGDDAVQQSSEESVTHVDSASANVLVAISVTCHSMTAHVQRSTTH